MSKEILFQDIVSFILDCKDMNELFIISKASLRQLEQNYEEYLKLMTEAL